MIHCRKVIVLLVLGMAVFFSAFAAEHTNKAFRNFWHPVFLGERLNYCTLDGKKCGKAVANQYCQMLGYDSASQQVIAHNVGLTRYLDQRAQCKGWECDGFMTIACVTRLNHTLPKSYFYREKLFAYPRFNDYRVDWCYNQNKGCGKNAADSFCSRMGFMSAKRFSKETAIGATKTIGSQQLCFGNKCEAFKMILCYR